MNSLLKIGCALTVVFLAAITSGCNPSRVPEVELRASRTLESWDSGPCFRKERCISVYLTPWCPACTGSLRFINELDQHLVNSDKVGLKVIIGWDEREKLDKMAGRVKGLAFFDDAARFRKEMKISSVPTWIVWDDRRNVVTRIAAGAPRGRDKDVVMRWFLREELGLEDYF